MTRDTRYGPEEPLRTLHTFVRKEGSRWGYWHSRCGAVVETAFDLFPEGTTLEAIEDRGVHPKLCQRCFKHQRVPVTRSEGTE